MAITIANVITNLDTYIGDTSTDRISSAERLQAITEATVWLQEELGNDHSIATYDLDYVDTLHYYKITTSVADLLEAADLRQDIGENYTSFTRKSSREMSEDIAQESPESAYAIERRDGQAYLVVNHSSKYKAKLISSLESLTADGGTWEVVETTSDAENLTVDEVEYSEGGGSLNFDIDVSNAVANRASIRNTGLNSMDLSEDENLSSWLLDVWLPDVTNFSSITLTWGSDTSNYWSATVTADANGNAFVAGKQTIKVNWSDATATGSPDASAIEYIQFDFNYTASQGDDTDYRVDYLRLVRPEKLKFYYQSWFVGADSNGTDIRAFSATTDVPFYSGQYDQYKYPVAHKAASILFNSLRLAQESQIEELEAVKALRRLRKIVPSSRAPEIKNFKVRGVTFARNRRFKI